MRLASIVALFSWLSLITPAHADAIDDRAEQLTGPSPYKVRLSAALWLAKKKNDRAVLALSQALSADSEYTVREVAASALGNLVTQRTDATARDRAVAALERASSSDANSGVRRSARRSLKRISKWLDTSAPPPSTPPPRPLTGTKVFVGIAPVRMGKKPAPDDMSKDLHTTVKDVLQRSAPAYSLGGGDSELPTRAELERAGMRGWLLGTNIAVLDVAKNGSKAEVRCTVALEVNPWDGRDANQRLLSQQAASASGSGTVTSSSTPSGIDVAKRDCVLAVAEQVMTKQVVPYLRKQNPTP